MHTRALLFYFGTLHSILGAKASHTRALQKGQFPQLDTINIPESVSARHFVRRDLGRMRY